MSLIGTRAFAATVSLVAALAVGAPAAFAGTYTLDLAVPSSGTVGQPLVIQATGSNPADDFFSSWLDVAAIPTSVLSACPAGYLNASQVASSTSSQGGENIATALRETSTRRETSRCRSPGRPARRAGSSSAATRTTGPRRP